MRIRGYLWTGLYCFLLCWFCPASWASEVTSPKSTPEATITFNHARFTVLTEQLIRMEYSESAKFEDRASLAFINRKLPLPNFTTHTENHRLSLRTPNLTLEYLDDGKAFNRNNLSISLHNPSQQKIIWHAGDNDDKNLKGTLRTLDMANGWDKETQLENGLISRAGWSLIDDSLSPLFDGDPTWNWVTPRQQPAIDWYFFGYGNQYKKALYDFTQVAGKIPLPPKYALGYWWSRYWIYNDDEMRTLVNNLREFHIPLDVLIIDMDWHETYGFSANNLQKDSQDQWRGWTGYTWNKQLFPEPEAFISWTNQQHIKTALNLHPASGIPSTEEHYDQFVQHYGEGLTHAPSDGYIPFNLSEKKWANTYFEQILEPMQQWGIDFWWLDWQQYTQDKSIPNLSVTWWLNYTFYSRMENQGNRAMIFHRWGGLGNHRYPIGFSGDANTNWQTLDFETYFTATAANVGYAYWSHDIGGHISNGEPTDGELYLRWIQFGALSPILRTHASKISTIERRPWMFPAHFFAMRDAINLRYQLAPYLYAAARNTFDTGIAMIHPLYYEYPNSPQAYSYKTEYFFGDKMIVAPITSPINKHTQLADKKLWLPKGDWFELSSGSLLAGNRELTRNYTLNEIPLFVAAGSIIPMNPVVENLQQKPNTQVLTFIPGAKKGSSLLYEDDEQTLAYQTQEFASRRISYEQHGNNTLDIHIAPMQGQFTAMPGSQAFNIKLLNRELPSRIWINQQLVQLPAEFLPQELASLIHLPAQAAGEALNIRLEFANDFNTQDQTFNGNKGFLQRMSQTTERLKFLVARNDWGGTLPNDIYRAGNTLNLLRYHPEKAVIHLQQLNKLKASLGDRLHSIPSLSAEDATATQLYLSPENAQK